MSKEPLLPIHLIKFIRENSSLARRDVMAKIKDGCVTVNGKIIYDGTLSISKHDVVRIDNQAINKKPLLYYKFNKPVGTISTFKDPKGRRDLSFHLKKNKLDRTLKPCGRLDTDSSGLLLFTNDGDFINQILHPKYTIEKTYEITLNKPLAKSDQTSLTSGFFLNDGPMSMTFKSTINPKTFVVVISIGRNRILRRSFEYFGYTIVKLHRIGIGSIQLGRLNYGEFDSLSMASNLISPTILDHHKLIE